jgi:restriction system protein
MQPKWKTYQEQAAQFFTHLGLLAAIEERISGVRGEHNVDVLVTGKVHGLDLRWIVECKDWASNVPKEKVLALFAIVQDTGADKGILLSEVGFQSGAIKVSRNTNVLLTSPGPKGRDQGLV